MRSAISLLTFSQQLGMAGLSIILILLRGCLSDNGLRGSRFKVVVTRDLGPDAMALLRAQDQIDVSEYGDMSNTRD